MNMLRVYLIHSNGFSSGISMFLYFPLLKYTGGMFVYLSLVLSSSRYRPMLSQIADFPQSVQVYMLCICFVFVCTCWVVCLFVSFNSPLTMTVTWSLPTPIRFLTSQTKVVFTASSTFSTFSSLPLICTVSGISPERLQRHEHIGMWRREREQEMRKGFWFTLGTMRAARQMCIYRNVLYCAMSSNSTNLDGQCKTNQFSPSSKGNPLSHIGGECDGDMGKIKTAGARPKNLISPILNFQIFFLFFQFWHSYANSW